MGDLEVFTLQRLLHVQQNYFPFPQYFTACLLDVAMSLSSSKGRVSMD